MNSRVTDNECIINLYVHKLQNILKDEKTELSILNLRTRAAERSTISTSLRYNSVKAEGRFKRLREWTNSRYFSDLKEKGISSDEAERRKTLELTDLKVKIVRLKKTANILALMTKNMYENKLKIMKD